MDDGGDAHRNSTAFEHSPTALGPLADFARTPLYPPPPPPPPAGPPRRPSSPRPHRPSYEPLLATGTCTCGAGPSTIRAPEQQAAPADDSDDAAVDTTTHRTHLIPWSALDDIDDDIDDDDRDASPTTATRAFSCNPFTGEEPDYDSITRPARLIAITTTIAEVLMDDDDSDDSDDDDDKETPPSPTSAYSDDLFGAEHDTDFEPHYPETTRRPTALDQAQAEVNRMLRSQQQRRRPMTDISHAAVMDPVTNPRSMRSASAVVRAGNHHGHDDGDFEPHYPETTRRPTPLDQAHAEVDRMLRAQQQQQESAAGPSTTTTPTLSRGSMHVQPLRVTSPPPRPARAGTEQLQSGWSSTTDDCHDDEGSADDDAVQVGVALVLDIGALGTLMPFPDPIRITTTTATQVRTAPYSDPLSPLSPTLPPILQPPHPTSAPGAGAGPQPMWIQALTAHNLLPTLPSHPASVIRSFLTAMRGVDLERKHLVNRIEVGRTSLTRRHSVAQEWLRCRMMELINRLYEHDSYHWPMLEVLEYGDADSGDDDDDEDMVQHERCRMDSVSDWNPDFDWDEPFAPSWYRRGSDSGDSDDALLSPKTHPVAGWNSGFSWSQPAAASRGSSSSSCSPTDDEALVSPKTTADFENIPWSNMTGTFENFPW
ncbi:uncharacterized protein BKCO1_17000151 [Diplodia corticola]|uniref:Uncharacterized protein n=1 Tax=Diplodia corticola TaxID=236234 RepID=A0A1J9S6B0_9PEZI|nr:uncharacterized protein BKCO1_17000151 [Diplodia corticola]OJD35492.1 hypothetical protein BKCO1_17000151 [Diplodia corticola]